MTDALTDDSAVFRVGHSDLLNGVRAAAIHAQVEPVTNYLLTRCGLLRNDELTEEGRALFKLAWVVRKQQEAETALGQALRQLTPLQVIEQELRGLGPVPEDGVRDLLLQHRAVPDETSVNDVRPTFRWLNKVDVLVYSLRDKTVRSLAPAPDAALGGEIQAIAAMISPKTPYRNVARLRRIIRPLKGIVWWVDAHFNARALEELAEELDPEAVREIRILSGDANNVVAPKSLKDFNRFQEEMEDKGIGAEWRVDAAGNRDWHDRWLADDTVVWNVPPVNTLFKNDYCEIFPGSRRPPFDHWWNRATARN